MRLSRCFLPADSDKEQTSGRGADFVADDVAGHEAQSGLLSGRDWVYD